MTEQLTVKWCSRCEGEFEYWVESCPDCELELIVKIDGGFETDPRFAPPVGASLDLQDPVLVRTAPADWCNRLRESLVAAGVTAIIRELPADCAGGRCGPVRLGVFVERRDAELATDLDQQVAAIEIPGAPEPSYGELTACPACGTPLGDAAVRCRECGLEFPEIAAE